MTRATRQLWEEREKFLKHERGWDPANVDDDDLEIEDLDLNELSLEEKEILKGLKAEDKKQLMPLQDEKEVDLGPNPELLSTRDKERLLAVERFYVSFMRYITDHSTERCPSASPISGDCPTAAYSCKCHGDRVATTSTRTASYGQG